MKIENLLKNTSLIIITLSLLFLNCKKEDDDDEIELSLPIASFNYEVKTDYEVYFFNTSQNYTQSPLWDFGDGNSAKGDTVVHVFDTEGTYSVKLTVSNSDGMDEKKENVKVDLFIQVAEISTSFGKILMYLYKQTPVHRENFIKLAESGFYNGTTFHRVIEGFVIQGGDPNSKDGNPLTDGTGGPGYTLEAEFVQGLTHVHGAVGTARQGNNVNPEKRSNGSQFYIVDNENGTHNLDTEYTVFGILINGKNVVRTIAQQSKDSKDRPIDNIEMQVSIKIENAAFLETEYGFVLPE